MAFHAFGRLTSGCVAKLSSGCSLCVVHVWFAFRRCYGKHELHDYDGSSARNGVVLVLYTKLQLIN